MNFQEAFKKYVVEGKMYSSMELDKVKPLSTTKYDLIDAVKTGDYRIVQRILQNKYTNINVQDDTSGKTPLMIAAEKGLTTIVRLLLANKELGYKVKYKVGEEEFQDFGINLKDGADRTALMLAVLNDRPAVVEELLKNSKIDLGKTDSEGKTALNLAKQLGNKKIVAILEKPVETSTTDTTTDTSKVDTSTTSKLVCTPENKEKYKKAKEEYAALEKQKAELTKTIETLQAEYETSQSTATATKLIKLFRDQTKTLEKMTSLQSLITDMEVCGIHKQ